MPDSNNPLFERRHYNAIAETIAALGCVTDFVRRNLATEFALRIAGTNSRFNQDRFISACMGEPAPAPAPAPLQPCHIEGCQNPGTHVCRIAGPDYRYCSMHCGSDTCCTPADN